jgi:selenophosphate synthase
VDAYIFGRIAAANALSGIYAMGGTPLVAVNLLGWPCDTLPAELAAEVLLGAIACSLSRRPASRRGHGWRACLSPPPHRARPGWRGWDGQPELAWCN